MFLVEYVPNILTFRAYYDGNKFPVGTDTNSERTSHNGQLRILAVCSSETSLSTYLLTQRYNPEKKSSSESSPL